MSKETGALRVRPEKAGRGETALTGSIIHGGHEHHAGDKVPDGVDLERLERLGLIERKGKPTPSSSGARQKAVEHEHGDAKHKHPVAFDDLATTALAGIAKSHKDIEVDTSREDEAAVRADLLAALHAAHPTG